MNFVGVPMKILLKLWWLLCYNFIDRKIAVKGACQTHGSEAHNTRNVGRKG